MDTRSKILTAREASDRLAGRHPLLLITGHFNPLLAAHAHELAALCEQHPGAVVLAVVLPTEDEVLTLQARAEMAAGLRMIDYVVTLESGDVEAILRSLQPDCVVRREERDRALIRQLIEHVHGRQVS